MVELGKQPNSISVDQITEGIESLRIAQSLVWKLSKGRQGYEYKAQIEKDIANQILRAKKIRWLKEQQLKRESYEEILLDLKSQLDLFSSDDKK